MTLFVKRTEYWNSDQAGRGISYGKVTPQAGYASHLKRPVTPKRRRNGDLRTREYLTEAEVERVVSAARRNRHGHRDATMILVAYRHGLRVGELADLRWDQVDSKTATLHVRRVKQGTPSTHPILGDELRALRRLQREQDSRHSYSHRNAARRSAPPVSPVWSNARALRPSSALRFTRTWSGMPVAMRWPTGVTTRGRSKPTSGTKNIQHTVRYTELSSTRFKNLRRE